MKYSQRYQRSINILNTHTFIPSFRNHGQVWVFKAAGIPSAKMDITNNPSESMIACIALFTKVEECSI